MDQGRQMAAHRVSLLIVTTGIVISAVLFVSSAFAQTSSSDQLLNALQNPNTQAQTSPTSNPTDPNSPEYIAAVEKLRALILELTRVLSNLLAERAKKAAPQPSATNLCNPITRPLAVGSRGSDVLCLQRFLIAQGHLAQDLVTGFFGPLTAAAVQLYQSKQGIVSSGSANTTGYGAIGPQTRQMINQALVSGATTNTSGSATNQTTVSTQAGCILDGVTLAHGATGGFYAARSVAYGQTCSSVPRTCSNGVLGGSSTNIYATCAVQATPTPTLLNCSFNGQSVASSQSVTAYYSSSIAPGGQCAFETRVCTNGSLSGSYSYSTCSVQGTTSCSWNGLTIQSGYSATAYQSSSVAYGSQCVSEQRACNNGFLTGSYLFSSCSVAAAGSCTFNGQTIAHNASVTGYQAATVAYGSQCVSESRSCSNGTLSGSYTHSACSVAAAGSCTLDGLTVAHNQSAPFYTTNSVAYGSTCASVAQTRTCSNGALNGSSSYNRASCSVAAPPPVTPGSQTFTASGTFTVPAHNTLTAQCWGGGGGGSLHKAGTCDPGGGDCAEFRGSDGGLSSFNSTVIAYAGLRAGADWVRPPEGGGGGEGPAPINGGAGGSASGGDTNQTGSNGGASGGASGMPWGGNGIGGTAAGSGGSGGTPGYAGSVPGGGGGGYLGFGDDWGAGGGGGGFSQKSYSSGMLGVGSAISIIVGQGGAGANDGYGSSAFPGARGECRVSWQ